MLNNAKFETQVTCQHLPPDEVLAAVASLGKQRSLQNDPFHAWTDVTPNAKSALKDLQPAVKFIEPDRQMPVLVPLDVVRETS